MKRNPPDLELIRLVAVHVFGYEVTVSEHHVYRLGTERGGWTTQTSCPDWPNDRTACWDVVEALRKRGLKVCINAPGPDYTSWDVRGWNERTNSNRFIAHADTAPRAICLAALDACGVSLPEVPA